jgi:hypothetical protein
MINCKKEAVVYQAFLDAKNAEYTVRDVRLECGLNYTRANGATRFRLARYKELYIRFHNIPKFLEIDDEDIRDIAMTAYCKHQGIKPFSEIEDELLVELSFKPIGDITDEN